MKHQFIIRDAKTLYYSHHADADYIHWGAMDSWTLDEAIALSLGKNPKLINWDFVYEFTLICKEAKEYERRRELIASAVPLGNLTDPVSPSLFLRWATEKNINIPQKLVTQVYIYLAPHEKPHEVSSSHDSAIPKHGASVDSTTSTPTTTEQDNLNVALKSKNDVTDGKPIVAVDEPPMQKGKNMRTEFEAWVKYQAKLLVIAVDTERSLAEKIFVLANQNGYQSERQSVSKPLTLANIIKMIPIGTTGGREKNGNRSKK